MIQLSLASSLCLTLPPQTLLKINKMHNKLQRSQKQALFTPLVVKLLLRPLKVDQLPNS